MQKIPDFYANQIVAGKVIEIKEYYAVLDVCGWNLPLETRFISWNIHKNPAELLSIGDRLKVVVNDTTIGEIDYRKNPTGPKIRWHGYWLSRLPIMEDNWPKLHAKYSEGSIIEVEFLGYCNYYVARAKTPEGFIIELLINDIHPQNKSLGFDRDLLEGERVQLVIRKLYNRSMWVQRYAVKLPVYFLAEAGYINLRTNRNPVV